MRIGHGDAAPAFILVQSKMNPGKDCSLQPEANRSVRQKGHLLLARPIFGQHSLVDAGVVRLLAG
jgi:hypothetical protein